MAKNCSYTFAGPDGKETTIKGLHQMQAYLANGGFEHFFPDKQVPWMAQHSVAVAPQQSENTFPDLQQAINHLAQQFGPGIQNLVDSGVLNFTQGKEDWPEDSPKNAEAVYVNGKATVDLSATSKDRLAKVVLHEIGEHYNLKRMLGSDNYAALQKQIVSHAKQKGSTANKVWNQVEKLYPHLIPGDESFVAEVIAKLGEAAPHLPWYKRLMARIKSFLTQHGLARGFIAGTLTPDDMHDLLVASLRSAYKGRVQNQPSYVTMASTLDENPLRDVDHWEGSAYDFEDQLDGVMTKPKDKFQWEGDAYEYEDQVDSGIGDRKTKPGQGKPDFSIPPERSDEDFAQPTLEENLKNKKENLAEKIFNQRLAFLTVRQMGERAAKYLPIIQEKYVPAMLARDEVIVKTMQRADRVLDKWKSLPWIVQRRLGENMQYSTLHDVDASRDWISIAPLKAKGGTVYAVVSQAKFTPSNNDKVSQAAVEAGQKPDFKYATGKEVIFASEDEARSFAETLRRIQDEQSKFRAGKLKDENVVRESAHADLKERFSRLPKEAQEVYRETYKEFETLTDAKQQALFDRIDKSIFDNRKRAAAIAQMREHFESNKLSFYYAPLARFGKHWFYGEDSDGNRWFKTFESEPGREQWMDEFKAAGGKEIGSGTTIDDLLKIQFEGVSDNFIKSIQDIIAESGKLAEEDAKALQDDIYQMYLSSLPDVSMRHNAMHRKGTLGFDEDAMRAFAFAMHHGASQLANMTEGRVMNDVVKEAGEIVQLSSNLHRYQEAVLEQRASEFLRDHWDELASDSKKLLKDAPKEDKPLIENAIKQFEALPGENKDAAIASINAKMSVRQEILDAAAKLVGEGKDKTRTRRLASNVVSEVNKAYLATVATNSTEMDQIASAVRQFNFMYMLGFGISSGIVNLLQVPVVAAPLMAGTHGIAKTTAALNANYKAFTAAVMKGRTATDADGNSSISVQLNEALNKLRAKGDYSSKEYRQLEYKLQALNTYKEDGTISRTQSFDVIGIGREGEMYGGKMQDLSKRMGWIFHHGERFNREVTVMAAYDLKMAELLAKNPDMEVEDAHGEAVRYGHDINFKAHGDYSSANAARIFRGWPASIALQFAKYPQQMYYTWAQTAATALSDWKKAPEGPERDAAKQQAREAAATLAGLVVMQFSVAGALGLPLIGATSVALDLLAAVAPGDDDDDVPYDFKQSIHVALKDIGDALEEELGIEGFGKNFAETMAKGPLTALTGADIHSRMSLADIKFRPQKHDLEGRDLATNFLAGLFGPAGGMLQKVVEGLRLIRDHYYERGLEQLAPKAVSDVMQAGRFLSEGARAIHGDKLKDMSLYEDFLKAIGFSSAELNLKYEQEEYIKTAKDAITKKKSDLVREARDARLEHRPVDMTAIKAFNSRHPHYKIEGSEIQQAVDKLRKTEKLVGKGLSERDEKILFGIDRDISE